MSIKIMSQVWERGPADKAEILVLLAIADYCNDDGECWPAMSSIARKARMTERGVQKICARLCEIGWLQIDLRMGRKGCNLYRITPNHVHPEPRSPRTPYHQTPNPVPKNPEPRSPEPSLTINKPSCASNGEDWFDAFWKAYPRKVGKAAAQKAFAKAVKQSSPAEIVAGLNSQIQELISREVKYQPHPATWLNQGRWADEEAKQPKRDAQQGDVRVTASGQKQMYLGAMGGWIDWS